MILTAAQGKPEKPLEISTIIANFSYNLISFKLKPCIIFAVKDIKKV